jgi:transcriptional regulator with XRE-family HTH domain
MPADKAVIGARLRAEREARIGSRAKMARRLRDASDKALPSIDSLIHMVKEWERGKHGVSEDYRELYAAALGIDEADLFGDERRGEHVVHAPSKMLAELLPAGELSGRLAPFGQAGAGSVEDLSARVHALRLADDVLAGGDLLGPAFRELGAAVRIYRETSHSQEVGRGLLAVIGEFAQIAGWVASDAGQFERAAETYRLGIDAARQAGDGTLESNLTGSLAYQLANTGNPGKAVGLAEEALAAAGPDAPARARALAWDRLAWAHAKTQDAQGTMRALAEAGDALGEGDGRDTPAYLYWVDDRELQVMEARAYTELRRPLRAVPLLVDVLGRYDATRTRELTLYLSWLAVALADANEPEEAAATAGRMLALGADVASVRTAERARVVLARLEPYRDVPEVRQVLQSAR